MIGTRRRRVSDMQPEDVQGRVGPGAELQGTAGTCEAVLNPDDSLPWLTRRRKIAPTAQNSAYGAIAADDAPRAALFRAPLRGRYLKRPSAPARVEVAGVQVAARTCSLRVATAGVAMGVMVGRRRVAQCASGFRPAVQVNLSPIAVTRPVSKAGHAGGRRRLTLRRESCARNGGTARARDACRDAFLVTAITAVTASASVTAMHSVCHVDAWQLKEVYTKSR